MGSGAGEALLQKSRARGAALLGVELDPDERAVLDDCGVAFARRNGRIGHRFVRVREPVRLATRVDLCPADARDAVRLEPHGPARHDAEAGDAAVLLALVEGELKAEADAENRTAGLMTLAQDAGGGTEPVHRRARRAHAGEHCEVGPLEVVGDLCAEPADGELDGAHVARAVARDRHRLHIRPFVDGSTSLSLRMAALSARPVALNAASATWCASSPVESTCSPSRALSAKLASTCRARPGSGSMRMLACLRPPRSSAAPSAMAASSAAWWSPVSRSPLPSSTRSKPAWNASCSRKWSYRPAPVETRTRLAPSSTSRTRSVVSAVARECRARRVCAAGSPASAARRASSSSRSRTEIRIASGNTRTTHPAASSCSPTAPGSSTGT